MSTEASRAVTRFASNYLRLGLNLALGLVFVRFVLGWIGKDALAVILLLGAGAGFGLMFRELVNRTAVRELAGAHHAGDRGAFREIYNSALVVSAGAAMLAGLTFVVLYLVVDRLKITPGLHDSARVMALSQGVYITLATALSPAFNMLVVTERFVPYNAWTLAERACMLASALILRYGAGMSEPAPALTAWSVAVAAGQTATLLVPVGMLMWRDERLRPAPGCATRRGLGSLTPALGWYFAVELASALHERVGALIMNIFYGPMGNRVFGLSVNFTSYVRQATQGVTFGLDAVTARLSVHRAEGVAVLLRHSTRVHGLVAFPAGLLMLALAHPLVRLWLGKDLGERELDVIASIVRILSVPLTVRAVSDGWMMILYGAGHLRRYAPALLIGAAFNPASALAILWVTGAPEWALYVTPWVFCAVYSAVHGLVLPRVGARWLGVPFGAFFSPLGRPLAGALCAAPVLAASLALGLERTLPGLAATVGAFGVVYALSAAAIALSAEERARFLWNPARRLLPGPGPKSDARGDR